MAAEGNKTEKATPKKRRDERKKGNVFMSRDAVAVAGLLGTFGVLWLLTNTFAEQRFRKMGTNETVSARHENFFYILCHISMSF